MISILQGRPNSNLCESSDLGPNLHLNNNRKSRSFCSDKYTLEKYRIYNTHGHEYTRSKGFQIIIRCVQLFINCYYS